MKQNIGDVTCAVKINRHGVCKIQLLNKLLWALTIPRVTSEVLHNLVFCLWVTAVAIVTVAGLYWVLCVKWLDTHLIYFGQPKDTGASSTPIVKGLKRILSSLSKLTYLVDGGSRCIQLWFFSPKYLLITHCARARDHEEKSGPRLHADGVCTFCAMKIECWWWQGRRTWVSVWPGLENDT